VEEGPKEKNKERGRGLEKCKNKDKNEEIKEKTYPFLVEGP
jgi:hypothetical protein